MATGDARTMLLAGGALLLGVAFAAQAFAQQALEPPSSEAPKLELRLRNNDVDAFEAAPGVFPRALEFELSAPHHATGAPLDFAIAHTAGFAAGESGDIDRVRRSAEVRIGRALGDPDGGMSSQPSRLYVFAGADNEALTWRPGQQGRSLAIQQDRVEIGDMQAGVTYDRGAVQASLAYVEREISATVGRTTTTRDENFAGLTLTMRR